MILSAMRRGLPERGAVLGCNIHDQMAAWVVVVATPWYGKKAADGSLRLAAMPVHHQRAFSMRSAQNVEVELVIQMRNPSHGSEVVQRLADAGFEAQVS